MLVVDIPRSLVKSYERKLEAIRETVYEDVNDEDHGKTGVFKGSLKRVKTLAILKPLTIFKKNIDLSYSYSKSPKANKSPK